MSLLKLIHKFELGGDTAPVSRDISNLFTYYKTPTTTKNSEKAPATFNTISTDPLIPPTFNKPEESTVSELHTGNWFDRYSLPPEMNTKGVTIETPAVSTSATMSANRNVRFMGKDINLQHAVDIITLNQAITAGKAEFLHTCTRHVTNALKGETNPRKAGGLANPQAMYNLLVKDGWTDVLDDNYTPQVGDVYTVWGAKGGKYGMHSSMWNGSQWLSYNADNHGKSTPWYFNLRGKSGVHMHIMRYGTPAHRLGGKLSMLKTGGIIKMELGSIFSIYNDANAYEDDLYSSDEAPISFATPSVGSAPLDALLEAIERRVNDPDWYKKYSIKSSPVTSTTAYTSSTTPTTLPSFDLSGKADLAGRFSDKKQFVLTMYPIVKSYLDKMGKGLFTTTVLAHMALESGWGAKVSGNFNYGGMKATKQEDGVVLNTTEYYNGLRTATQDKFKNFKDINDFMDFYTKRLNNKFKAFDGPDYAANIRAHGYYTAPLDKYRKTLQSMEKQVKSYLS